LIVGNLSVPEPLNPITGNNFGPGAGQPSIVTTQDQGNSSGNNGLGTYLQDPVAYISPSGVISSTPYANQVGASTITDGGNNSATLPGGLLWRALRTADDFNRKYLRRTVVVVSGGGNNGNIVWDSVDANRYVNRGGYANNASGLTEPIFGKSQQLVETATANGTVSGGDLINTTFSGNNAGVMVPVPLSDPAIQQNAQLLGDLTPPGVYTLQPGQVFERH